MPERSALAALLLLAAGCQRREEQCLLSDPVRELTLAPNLDDDDGDGRIDGVQSQPPSDDGEVVWLQLTGQCQGEWSVLGAPAGEVRLWLRGAEAERSTGASAEAARQRPSGARVERGRPAEAHLGGAPTGGGRQPPTGAQIGGGTGAVLTSGLVRWLGVEVVRGRSPQWGGAAQVVGPAGTLKLIAAPVLLRQPNQPPTEVWAAEIARADLAPTLGFLEQLEHALPPGVALRRLGGEAVGADRWVQDAFQAATALGQPLVIRLPRAGPTRQLSALSHRDGLPREVGSLGTGSLAGGIFDFGGNLDVLAPHQAGDRDYPHGRLIIGGGASGAAEPVTADLLAWLAAQGAQVPPVRLPVTWLYSGHLDDALLALPSPPGAVRVLLASPADALAALDLARELPPEWKTTAFTAFTQHCQHELDAMEAALRTAVAPTRLETVRLPVVFVPRQARGETLAAPAYPNPVNALVVDPVVVLGELASPPLGPRQAQVLRQLVEARLQAAGLVPKWVDVSPYAPHGGSVHCAIEVLSASLPP